MLPGFITTEGFPHRELNDNPLTRRLVSTPEAGARAILDAGLNGKAERYVPQAYALAAALRAVVPGVVRRVMGGKAASRLVTRTGDDDS